MARVPASGSLGLRIPFWIHTLLTKLATRGSRGRPRDIFTKTKRTKTYPEPDSLWPDPTARYKLSRGRYHMAPHTVSTRYM